MVSKRLARLVCSAFLLACERKVMVTLDVKPVDAVAPHPIPSGAECAAAGDCIQQGSCIGVPACTSRTMGAQPICDPKFPPPKMPSFSCGCDAGRCAVVE